MGEQSARPARGAVLLVGAFAIEFAVSSGILATASLRPPGEQPSLVIGIVDVALVVVLVGTLLAMQRATGRTTALRHLRIGHQLGIGVVVAVLVVTWLMLGRLDLGVLLPGLAWRLYVLLSALPSAVAALLPGE